VRKGDYVRPNFMEKELVREKVGFRKNDNAFLSVSDPQALQATSSSSATIPSTRSSSAAAKSAYGA
jgi:hypothetical protein